MHYLKKKALFYFYLTMKYTRLGLIFFFKKKKRPSRTSLLLLIWGKLVYFISVLQCQICLTRTYRIRKKTYIIGQYRLCRPRSRNDFQNHLYVGGHNTRMCQVDVKSRIYKRRNKYEIAKGVNGLFQLQHAFTFQKPPVCSHIGGHDCVHVSRS